jgi:hypothetical protein
LAALCSIIISASTTGFDSALMSYDMDTSPKRRKINPEFYGFVPPAGRLVFFIMVLNSASQFLAKIMAVALLCAVSKTWVLLYLLGDLGLYFLYTILRNDFFYYIPMESHFGSLAFSLLSRIMMKVRAEQVTHKNLYPTPTP